MGEVSLSKEGLGVLLELANITSGSAATTIGMLVDQDIELSSPTIDEFATLDELLLAIPPEAVMAVLQYLHGMESSVCTLLDLPSSLCMANIMMGNTGDAEATEISDIELSAVGEAISQMMGATANSLSQLLSKPVEISAPELCLFSREKLVEMIPECASDGLVLVHYQVVGSTLLPNCVIYQIYPAQHALNQIKTIQSASAGNPPEEAPLPPPSFSSSPPPVSMGAGGAAPEGYAQGPSQPSQAHHQASPVTVRPVEFPSFESHIPVAGAMNKNLELVMDVCLNLTVELGRAELPIKEVLELTRGSVIELNRVAGESVDLFVNGKMIAKGEVVVIEDNFGLRITSIISPADRLRSL